MYALYQLENGDLVCDYNNLRNPAIILIQEESVKILESSDPKYYEFKLPENATLVTKVNVDWIYSENEFNDYISVIALSNLNNELIVEVTCEMCMGEYNESIKKKRALSRVA